MIEKTRLGERYRDGISGYEGTATARAEYLHGCPQVKLETVIDGKPDHAWIDEPRLSHPVADPIRGFGPAEHPHV